MALSERTKWLLAGGEGTEIEYKTKITQEFNEILVAFANNKGGVCLFGVEDDKNKEGRHIGKVVGIEISDRMRGRIQSRADQTIDKIDITIETEYDDKGNGIYIVTVLEGKNKPYCTGGGRYLIRRDGQNCSISPNMMERIIEHRINTDPSAQPILQLIAGDVKIHPKIEVNKNPEEVGISLKDKVRYVINFPLKVVNIGNIPAQNIIVDAEVRFKKRRPFGNKSLPIHLYKFIDFLSPESTNKERSEKEVMVSFDNFVAKEIIFDFFEGRNKWPGFPFLPSIEDMQDAKLWPSPSFEIRCLYSDIHGQNYCSEIQRFIHIWPDSKKKILDIYFTNMNESSFKGIKKIDQAYKDNYNYQRRNLRYSAFDGKKYDKGELMLLKAVQKRRKAHNKTNTKDTKSRAAD
ncbi:MAG: ATP-binding protein [Thermodesulfovibrionales bacterium]|nr:ATP-binding protein [Thermodesulfovibrionales bacterium]